MRKPKLRIIKGGCCPRQVENHEWYSANRHLSICDQCRSSNRCDIGRVLYERLHITLSDTSWLPKPGA